MPQDEWGKIKRKDRVNKVNAEKAGENLGKKNLNKYRIRFGKYKGRPYKCLPTSYLEWLVELDTISNFVKGIIYNILAVRPDRTFKGEEYE